MILNLRSDLKIKYYLGLYNEEDLYDDSSVLFDILQYILKVIQVKQKKLDFENIKFSSKSLKYVFGDKINDETFKSNLVKRIKSLIADEYLQVDGDSLKITEKGITNFYIIQ